MVSEMLARARVWLTSIVAPTETGNARAGHDLETGKGELELVDSRREAQDTIGAGLAGGCRRGPRDGFAPERDDDTGKRRSRIVRHDPGDAPRRPLRERRGDQPEEEVPT
jgi:hypothetical protein